MHGHILAATGVSKLIIIVMPIYTWAVGRLRHGTFQLPICTSYLLPWLTVDRFLPCADVTLEKEKT